jgi:hypothetical protein
MRYPTGPLLAALASRILSNLDLIEARAPKSGSARQNEPPYADTQLLISLLGVLIFPHEKAPFALGNLAAGLRADRSRAESQIFPARQKER